MISHEKIIDRGRGPEIDGTRITVYAVLDYLLEGWSPKRIGALFNVSRREIEAVIDYIHEHKIEVLRDYLTILERGKCGNPPEIQEKLDANEQKFQELIRQVRAIKDQANTEIRELIDSHRTSGMKGNAQASNHGGQ